MSDFGIILLSIIIPLVGIIIWKSIEFSKQSRTFRSEMPNIDKMTNNEFEKWFYGLTTEKVSHIPIGLMQKLEDKAYPSDKISSKIQYLNGHLDLNEALEGVFLFLCDKTIDILQEEENTIRKIKLASIKKDSISNIAIEDETTIEKRVSFKRILLVGIFALAWKKKEVNEMAFIIIEWQEGKFSHETTFQIIGKGAMQNANIIRNKLIKALK